MPSMGGGTGKVWTIGSWTTPLQDVSLIFDGTNQWSRLLWREQNTSNEALAYVRVDILDDSDSILQSNVAGEAIGGDNRQITLSSYVNVKSVDIKIKFKLYGKTQTPIVSLIDVK